MFLDNGDLRWLLPEVPFSDEKFDAVFARITVGLEYRHRFVVTPAAPPLSQRESSKTEKQGQSPEKIKAVFHSDRVYFGRDEMASEDLPSGQVYSRGRTYASI